MSDAIRWFERSGPHDDIILVSRIRLLRNIEAFPFPGKMSEEMRKELEDLMDGKVLDNDFPVRSAINKIDLSLMEQEEKDALKERFLINQNAAQESAPCSLYVSEDESFSMTLNATDHLRLLLSARGNSLKSLYAQMDKVDDYIHDRLPFAFSEKYGYKTASLKTAGTGMRAYLLMHLPLLSEQSGFAQLVEESAKYGVVMKEGWTVGARKIGGLYVLYNQRSLGLKEQDIIDILTTVAERLMKEEQRLREETDSVLLKDRAYRAYGVLQYAVKLDLYEACKLLSDLLLGVSCGYFVEKSEVSVYELMLGIFPGYQRVHAGLPMGEREMKMYRASYIQEFLQEIEIND